MPFLINLMLLLFSYQNGNTKSTTTTRLSVSWEPEQQLQQLQSNRIESVSQTISQSVQSIDKSITLQKREFNWCLSLPYPPHAMLTHRQTIHTQLHSYSSRYSLSLFQYVFLTLSRLEWGFFGLFSVWLRLPLAAVLVTVLFLSFSFCTLSDTRHSHNSTTQHYKLV